MSEKENQSPESQDTPKGSGKKRNLKRILIPVAAVLAAVVILYGAFSLYNSIFYFKTNNARVATDIKTVTPLTSGRIVKWNVDVGSPVSENEVIGRLQNGSYLRSPIDGQVIESSIVVNQMVSTATVAAMIADTANIHIEANIEETDIQKIKVGESVKIYLDAYPGQMFSGHVSVIKPVTQQALSGKTTSFSTSGTYTKVVQLIPVEIAIDDAIDLADIIGTNAVIKVRIK